MIRIQQNKNIAANEFLLTEFQKKKKKTTTTFLTRGLACSTGLIYSQHSNNASEYRDISQRILPKVEFITTKVRKKHLTSVTSSGIFINV